MCVCVCVCVCLFYNVLILSLYLTSRCEVYYTLVIYRASLVLGFYFQHVILKTGNEDKAIVLEREYLHLLVITIATKVFIGTLPATRGVWVIIG